MYFKKQRGSAPGLPGSQRSSFLKSSQERPFPWAGGGGQVSPGSFTYISLSPHKTDKSALPPVTVTVISSLVNNARQNKIGSKGYKDFWVKGTEKYGVGFVGGNGRWQARLSCSGMTPSASRPLFLLLSPVVDLDSTLVISQDQEPLGLVYASTSPFVHHLARRERHPPDKFPKGFRRASKKNITSAKNK